MKLRYAHSIAWQEYNDTIYIKNIETNEDFVVKDVARDIWKIIGKNVCMDEIILRINEMYTIDEDIDEDINFFLEELLAKGLISYE